MQARPKIVKILVVALLVSLILAACGGGSTGKTWFNLPSAKVRIQPDGAMRVWGTRDAGATWAPLGEGLPERNAYLTILREAFDSTGEGDGLELYFGATTGEVFGSSDAGQTWRQVGDHLPPVYSVRTA